MREILFRGKRTDNGEWVYGDLLQNIDAIKIRENEKETKRISKSYEIDTKTIGQYIGLTDKNGKKIFEGDIVDVEYDIEYVGVAKERIGKFKVVFYKGCFMKEKINGSGLFHFIPSDVTTILGNVYDNPELLNKPVGNSDKLEVRND